MIVAVTGATGHVGINLIPALLEKGYQVRALIHRHSHGLQHLPVEIYKGDVLDRVTLLPFIEGASIVIHLAARISITGGSKGLVMAVNRDGTKNVLETAINQKIKRFIHFSSIHAINPHPLNKPVDEKRPLVKDERFSYDRSKAEGERLVLQAAANGLDAFVLSPTGIIGPADPEPSLIGQAVIDIINHKIPALVPGGYDWVDVRDVVSATVSSIDKGRTGEKYLLSGKYSELKEFSFLISKITGIRTVSLVIPMWLAYTGLPFIHLQSTLTGRRPLYTRESLAALREGSKKIKNDKARRELGFSPRPLEETLKDLIEWYKDSHKIHKKPSNE